MASRVHRATCSNTSFVAFSGNLVLKNLVRSDQVLLEAGAERVELRRGTSLMQAGDVLDALYFPETTLLAVSDGSGKGAEIAIVGREGFVGWPLLLGVTSACHSIAVSTRDGCVIKIGLGALSSALVKSISLRGALLPFIEALTVQMGTSILSNARDRVDVRIARWILMRHDRVGGDELLVQHAEIAASLGVRRASVTDVLHLLEGDASLRCRRGRIVIRNRRQLERLAATSYGMPEARYRSLMGPFGK